MDVCEAGVTAGDWACLGEVAEVEHGAAGGAGGLALGHVEEEGGRVQVPADRADDAGREKLGPAGPAVAAAVDAVKRDRLGARLRPGLPRYRRVARRQVELPDRRGGGDAVRAGPVDHQ